MHIGDVIRMKRIEAGKTREDLASETGISLVYIAKIEQGVRNPAPHKLAAIAAACNTTIPVLFAAIRVATPGLVIEPEMAAVINAASLLIVKTLTLGPTATKEIRSELVMLAQALVDLNVTLGL